MTATRAAVARTLTRADLPRATFVGSADRPQWTYGWGLSEAGSQVTVWCNPGGPDRGAFHQSALLARRVDQALVIAGYRTYHDQQRDPQQVIVLDAPAAVADRLKRGALVAAAVGIAFGFLSLAVGAYGPLLVTAICAVAAWWLGSASEHHSEEEAP